jgi:hypothetical protein
MSSPTENNQDERQIPAEYRTDIDHIQVIRVDVGEYIVRSRMREYDSTMGVYSQWSGWNITHEYMQLIEAMWVFSRLVIIKSSTDEYRWSTESRKIDVEFSEKH